MNTSLESLGSLIANASENDEAPDSAARPGVSQSPTPPGFRVGGLKFRE